MGIESKITAQGQISIPAEIRKKLGLKPGSAIEWYEEKGKVIVRRASKFSSQDIHDAVFARAKKKVTIQEMDEAIKDRMSTKHARH